jgi:hypothetical protein
MPSANEGMIDRAARVGLGIVLLIVGFGVMGGTGGVIVGLIGLVPLLTGLAGVCPIYSLLGIRTTES